MARVCTVCTHPEREAIEGALVADTPSRAVADRFGLSKDAALRHKSDHLPATLVKSREAAEVAHADNLLGQVRELQARALSILDTAEATGDLRTALGAIREARGNLELLAKLLGELKEGTTLNMVVAPEWLQIRAVILTALDPYPDARLAVASALEAHAGG